MITLVAVVGFLLIAYVSFFFTGQIYIKAEPFIEKTFSYTHVCIGILALLLAVIILYKIIQYIIYSPFSIYDTYKKNQIIKNEQAAVESYAKYINFGNESKGYRAKDDYKALMSTLNDKSMYWLLWFDISKDLPNEYESSIFNNKPVYTVYVYKKVKYLLERYNYTQAIDLLVSIQDFAKEFTWYYNNLIECYLNINSIDKAYAVYENRKKFIGVDVTLEVKIYIAKAKADKNHELQYLKKAYDLTKNTAATDVLLLYMYALLELKEYEEIANVLMFYVRTYDWIASFNDIAERIIFDMHTHANVFQALISAVHTKTDIFKLFCAEMYIKLQRHQEAREILITLLNTTYNERVICLLMYIDALVKKEIHHLDLLRKILKNPASDV